MTTPSRLQPAPPSALPTELDQTARTITLSAHPASEAEPSSPDAVPPSHDPAFCPDCGRHFGLHHGDLDAMRRCAQSEDACEGVHDHVYNMPARRSVEPQTDHLAALREQFGAGAPYRAEYTHGHSGLAAALYADGDERVARFDSEADAEALAAFLNFICAGGAR